MAADRDWSAYALLAVDIQNDFWTEKVLSGFPEFEKSCADLIAGCREAGLEVIHVRSRFTERDYPFLPIGRLRERLPCVEGTTGERVLEWAAEEAGESVFTKQSWDGFLNPELPWYLEARGKKLLFICGLISTVCVFLTAAGAAQRGFYTVILPDCCAAADREGQDRLIAAYKGLVFDTADSRHIFQRYGGWEDLTAHAFPE